MARAKTKKGATLKKAKAPESKPFSPGGTPVGWTFWNTPQICWRMWFLKYVEGLFPIITPRQLVLGAAYHGMMDKHSSQEIHDSNPGEFNATVVAEAQRLFVSRMSSGAPPMSKLIASEQELKVPGIPMTSKPDRIEEAPPPIGKRVREFKTANTFRENDAQVWAVSGEVIGEMMAAGVDTAIVDIIEKKKGAVRQIEVKLTEEKKSALVGLIEDLWESITNRMERFAAIKKAEGTVDGPAMDRLFPKALSNCGYQYGQPCPYYERCWSKSAGAHLYTKRPANGWRKFLGVVE